MSNDKIGCDAEGNCKARSQADCWRYRPAQLFGKKCHDENAVGQCKNCFALAEAREGDK